MRYYLSVLFVCLTLFSGIVNSAEKQPASPTAQQEQQALQQLKEPMYKPLMERYILDELKAVRQDQQKLREDVTKQVTHAQLDTADRALTYTTDTINNVFFIITATASILVLVGWNSLRDVKNKVEDIVNTRVSVITDEYEDRLKILEEKLRVRSEEILSNQERISVTNEVHSLWMRANLESDFANKIEIFDEILNRKPEDVEAIAYKADALLEINETAQAIELCNQAIDIDSDYGYAYWQRACAYALTHKHADALADIKMALEYSPNLRNELLHESAFASLHDNDSFNTIVAGEVV
ncbi:tetratricopeptide repeat protein [Pseudoalteromonas sp. SR43-6]|mgnify:FL=1|jgi:tetratricopeptide (TPR) repeat protein|uniref:Tetratricopeptide repeat protein n=1 Tax=Pseudoalteromonas distincta TaxID=77608 RepID=F3BHE7_9GAMM|nr:MULTISPECIES: tetratricopeptide repeat protein [Pseudoalteromonas]EGI73928.1 putative membrane protein with tetratricopeptide repeat domain [Pseudoalteromonas distincta]KAA1156070.1 tetratricopeptide repeat protein [Pseudoalteromonas distincta]KHM45951.1 tetratricopeptide domain protein [Pseudoalteromonas elyakovii]KID36432.1 tetratricopeptide domain protein [Pseudoalteromonas distincta]MBA6409184.1 tetratricopeptide repeat protein [Pseudoalteromonas sp. 5Ae-yellow]|tara:strand:- start:228 stop:1118 length:891 start_codon:yes stop_codon:yes gene_type:complete